MTQLNRMQTLWDSYMIRTVLHSYTGPRSHCTSMQDGDHMSQPQDGDCMAQLWQTRTLWHSCAGWGPYSTEGTWPIWHSLAGQEQPATAMGQ